MISKYPQKEDTPILERSRIGNRLGHQAARFWPSGGNAELAKTSILGRDPIPSKPGPARIVRYSQGRAQLGGFALTQAGGQSSGRLASVRRLGCLRQQAHVHDVVGHGLLDDHVMLRVVPTMLVGHKRLQTSTVSLGIAY
jgi:hypothetical protein